MAGWEHETGSWGSWINRRDSAWKQTFWDLNTRRLLKNSGLLTDKSWTLLHSVVCGADVGSAVIRRHLGLLGCWAGLLRLHANGCGSVWLIGTGMPVKQTKTSHLLFLYLIISWIKTTLHSIQCNISPCTHEPLWTGCSCRCLPTTPRGRRSRSCHHPGCRCLQWGEQIWTGPLETQRGKQSVNISRVIALPYEVALALLAHDISPPSTAHSSDLFSFLVIKLALWLHINLKLVMWFASRVNAVVVRKCRLL